VAHIRSGWLPLKTAHKVRRISSTLLYTLMTTYKERHSPWLFQTVWFASLGASAYGLYRSRAWDWYLTRDLFGFRTHLEIAVLCGLYVAWEVLSVLLHLSIPRPGLTRDEIFGNRYATLHDSVCIIPCHKAALTIHKTVEAALLSFPPQHIILSDNASTQEPPDHTKEVADTYRVRYLYTPVGNKTNAMLRAYKEMGQGARYVVLLDDDTLLPSDFTVRTDMFRNNPMVGCYSCNISVNQDEGNLVTRLVDYEYLSFCWNAEIQAYYATQRFAQGVIAVYTSLCFEAVYSQLRMLDGEPYSDDASVGIVARRCGFAIGQRPVNAGSNVCSKAGAVRESLTGLWGVISFSAAGSSVVPVLAASSASGGGASAVLRCWLMVG
jgi:hypothetical protein